MDNEVNEGDTIEVLEGQYAGNSAFVVNTDNGVVEATLFAQFNALLQPGQYRVLTPEHPPARL